MAIYEALESLNEPEDLVWLFVHEALRLYEDRLVTAEEKVWCNETIDDTAWKWFPQVKLDKALHRPILYSTYLKNNYSSVEQEDLRVFI